jgi:hypothetical protein
MFLALLQTKVASRKKASLMLLSPHVAPYLKYNGLVCCERQPEIFAALNIRCFSERWIARRLIDVLKLKVTMSLDKLAFMTA